MKIRLETLATAIMIGAAVACLVGYLTVRQVALNATFWAGSITFGIVGIMWLVFTILTRPETAERKST